MPEAHVNGVRVSYDVTGEGDPLVLVPGRGFPSAWWTHQHHVRPYVEAGYQVVRYDNRGLPPSECPPEPFTVADLMADLAALLDHLELRDCAVVGYSMGSQITQELAAARPDLVRTAVLIATVGRQLAWQRAFNEGALELFATGVPIPPKFLVGLLFSHLYDPDGLVDDTKVVPFLDELLGYPEWEDPGRSGQWRAYDAYVADPAVLGSIGAPTYVLGFERDLLMPPPLVREVADAIPGARYDELAGAGHWGLVLHPQEVTRRVLEFLA
jgi:pimeloyl-ACP methyl ester carboxylesterase